METAITKCDVESILNDYGINHPINNTGIYQNAFIHKSLCRKNQETEITGLQTPIVSNERLEFLGDAILSSVIASYVYERFENVDEGFLTRIRTRLVNGKQLSKFSKLIGLDRYLLLSKHVEEKCNGRHNEKLLENLFESFIGSIYLDFNNICVNFVKLDQCQLGYQFAENFITNVVERHIDFSKLILRDTNYKDQLLRYYQKNFECTPTWEEVSVEGPPHLRMFTIEVRDKDGIVIGQGKGKSKKKGEQKASKEALIHFNLLNEYSVDDSSDESDD